MIKSINDLSNTDELIRKTALDLVCSFNELYENTLPILQILYIHEPVGRFRNEIQAWIDSIEEELK